MSRTEYMSINPKGDRGMIDLKSKKVKKVESFSATVQSNGYCGMKLK